MSRAAPKKKTVASVASKSFFAVAPADFVAAFYAHLLPADLALFTVDERARIAASIWSLGLARRPGETRLRVFNPDLHSNGWAVDHTVIEIINDDMPFLVDSVTGVLQRRGLAVHLVMHPVLSLFRDAKDKKASLAKEGAKGAVAESFIHVQVDRCLDGAQLKAIEDDMRTTLDDVRAAVEDWPAMRQRMQETIDITSAPTGQKKKAALAPGEDVEEAHAFLRWLTEDNFTFLGYRDINLVRDKGGELTSIQVATKGGLGILRDANKRMFGGLRDPDKRKSSALRKYVRQHHVLFITKTNEISRVHRVLPMDAVFIRRFDEQGNVVGERLFIGLFTSKTYAQTPRSIPFMRRKIEDVAVRMGFAPQSHDGRSLTHILDTYPHDELFQISEEELHDNALGILKLQERARVALFTRADSFGRYITCLVYVPRDRYDSALRARIQDFLEKAYAGKAHAWHVRIDDSRLARAFVTIHLTPDSLHPNPVQLENDLREMCRTWVDRLRDSLAETYGEATALALLRRYGEAFPEDYREAVPPARAVLDIRHLERMRASPRFIVDLDDENDGRMRLKLLQPERPLLLSEALPLIENMGLKIDYMGGPYEIKFKDGQPPIYIHKFVGKPALPLRADFSYVKPTFEEALEKVWSGDAENDAFNALTLCVGLNWNAIVVLRAFARYLRQLRMPYSHESMAAALVANPEVAQKIYALFYVRHDPSLKTGRDAEMRKLEKDISGALAKIETLEHDRIIRRYVNLVQASMRTNYFQTGENSEAKPYLSIKFDSRSVDFMPLPKPLCEIFVYSPQTEAVHLRGGKVARGGIRWSDRREDFRSEILGLMKAQMVKNSVIVPVGSKGGFIVKRPPAEADKFLAEGIACYKILMRGLLDITDNRVNGKTVPPANVVRHDNDDPYLVVAADKGTAKFSDIANGISRDYGFWLDDAFASGGSAGYDHKGMGITARGAWEAVKRHFREMGKDIQTTDFSCIGVGDMSGDVFGNGMLLSKHTRLLGAFDHRHIICDPTPDTAKSFAERQRLFVLPRSSWADYDAKLLSKGGGIFARTEKSIKISVEMKKAYGITADTLPPTDFIQAMLKADIELLYFGGIGTYVKATDETQEEVGDRANEALRINGSDIRAKVIGEGANLGMTQRGRVEYALAGGRLNTDAIDNSAGVDTSDHEVNIKILLRKAVDKKKLTFAARDKLLASMTDEVGLLVLRDNYLQTQALTLAEVQAADSLSAHVRCMQVLEKSGLLNRAVEYLPNDAEIAERQRAGKGLTRPELAVLLAYAKIWLCQKIVDSNLPDDPALQRDIDAYFPAALRKAYAKDIAEHQLRREIAATVVTNDIVNHAGIRIILAVAESSDAEHVVRAYLLTRDAFDLPEVWAGIEALDAKVPAAAQTRMLLSIRSALAKAMQHAQTNADATAHLATSIETNRKGLAQLGFWLETHAADNSIGADWQSQGVPLDIARRVANFPILVGALDLINLAAKHKRAVEDLAEIFFGLEKRLEIGWLSRVVAQPAQTPWQRDAISTALAALAANHRRLTAQLVAKKIKGKTLAIVDWVGVNAASLERYDALLAEWRATNTVDLAMLMLANERLSALSA